jgi:hypothetical protein
MDKPLQALDEIQRFLALHDIQHVVIGGIANAIWGRPRVTLDAGLKALIGQRSITEFVELLSTQFRFRVPYAVSFVRRTYVVPLYASNRVGLDLGLAFLPYEFEAIERAIMTTYEGVTFPVCTAEDLIIHKAISERDKDWLDIDGILDKEGKRLDQGYIMLWLEQFADALERPQILKLYRSLLRAKKLA